jgi:WD40 repeat protein
MYIHTYTHTYIHTYNNIYIHAHTHTHKHTHAHTHTHTHQVLISGSADRKIAVWNLFGAKGAPPIKTLTGHFGSISAVCFVSWRQQVGSGSEDSVARTPLTLNPKP